MIVTLLTDFGTSDHYVGAMKGVVLTRAPGATLVDITHQIAPQDVRAGAFTLLAAYPVFPEGTVHVAVVDPGVGSARRPVVVVAGGQRFVGPDNGLFSYLYDREPGARTYHLTRERYFRHPVSATFHGRDIFAPVAGALAAGADPEDLGEPVDDPLRLEPLRCVRGAGGEVRGTVVHIDRFGNCVTSITRADLPDAPHEGLRIRLAGHEIHAVRRFFSEPAQAPDEPFAIWGSTGFLEVAVNRGSARERLGVERGAPITVRIGGADPEPRG